MSAGDDIERPDEKEEFERLKKAVEALGEFYDSVHIFASVHKTNDYGTVTYNYGHGSWSARYGQVREWLVSQEEALREKARRTYKGDEE